MLKKLVVIAALFIALLALPDTREPVGNLLTSARLVVHNATGDGGPCR